MKKILITLLTVILVVSCIALVACNKEDKVDPQDALNNYIFDQSGKTVSKDFVLPASISGLDASWTSNNPCVVIEKRADDYLAKVTQPDEGEQTVTLTVSVSGKTKEFQVRVKALDVYDFMDSYTFSKDKSTVVADFALETTYNYKGKVAQIEWSVEEQYADILSIDTQNSKCLVTPQTLPTAVTISAKFTYGGESSTKIYRMTVYVKMQGLEEVDYWYTHTNVSIDMSGYVVAIGTVYSEQYNNVTLYMVNDDFTAGYYLFRVKTTDAYAKLLKPGVHVTVTGTTNTNYQGLIETNAGGNLVVDTDVAEIDITTKVAAIDELVIGNLPATAYNESRLVSLTNWKVDDVAEIASGEGNVLTLTKGGKTVNVRLSKYLEGAYKPAAEDTTYAAIAALAKTFKKGDYVNVVGILGCYKNEWQIAPLSASAVTAGTADENTSFVGQDVAKAVAAVNAAVVDAKLDQVVRSTVEVTMPAESNGVTISYAACSYTKAVSVTENKIKVTPGATELGAVCVTYTKGDFKTVQFIYINSTSKADENTSTPSKVVERVEAPFVEGEEYVLVIDQKNTNKTLFSIPSIPEGSFYGETTEDINAAPVYKVEKDGDNYKIYSMVGDAKIYVSGITSADGKHANIKFDSENQTSWIYDAEAKAFKVELTVKDEKEFYFIGTYGSNATVGLSAIKNISTSFPAYLGKVVGGSGEVVAPTVTKELEKVEAPFVEGEEYVLVIDQKNINKTLFSIPSIPEKSFYGATTEDIEAAPVYKVEKDGDNYKIYSMVGENKIYVSGVASADGKFANIKFDSENQTSWIYDAEAKAFKVELTVKDEKEFYFIGTYSTYNTLSLSAMKNISTSFPAYLGKVVEKNGNGETTGGNDTPVVPTFNAPSNWTVVTELSQLQVGSVVVITGFGDNAQFGLGANAEGKKFASSIDMSNGVESVLKFEVRAGATEGSYALYNSEFGYFCAIGGGNNSGYEAELSEKSSWTIELTETGTSFVAVTTEVEQAYLRYNASSPRFSCYKVGTLVKDLVTIYIVTEEANA